MQQTRAAPPATLAAVLEPITDANEETGYSVARMATNRSSDVLPIEHTLALHQGLPNAQLAALPALATEGSTPGSSSSS